MNETALAKTATKDTTLRGQLSGEYFKSQIALALPKHMTADRFVRVALTALLKTPKLADCTTESVIECMLNCSALGLEPDGRRAHLIPYGNKCTLIVDYKGIVELAKRSGDVSNVFAQVVCENDSFVWENGEVKHQIDFKRDRGQMYAVYAQITFKDGTKQVDVMTKSEVDAIRKRSKSAGQGPWVTDFNEMAKKTVFRRASKWVTLSPEVADALDKEDDFTDIKAHVAVESPTFSAPPMAISAPVTTAVTPPTPAAVRKKAEAAATPAVQVAVQVAPEPPVAAPATPEPLPEAPPEPDGQGLSAEVADPFEVAPTPPEMQALLDAMAKHEVTPQMLIKFSSARNLMKEEAFGKEIETLGLADIRPDKLAPLTKNILAAGDTLKKIKVS